MLRQEIGVITEGRPLSSIAEVYEASLDLPVACVFHVVCLYLHFYTQDVSLPMGLCVLSLYFRALTSPVWSGTRTP